LKAACTAAIIGLDHLIGVSGCNMSRKIAADGEDAARPTTTWPGNFRRIERAALPAAIRNCRDRPSSSHGNHGPIVGAPVAPHIAANVPAESATQTAGAVTVTAMAVTGSTTEAAAQVIAAKTITSTTAAVTVAAGRCAGGKPGTSENKDNCKNNYGVA
jgi:hypothetical protein